MEVYVLLSVLCIDNFDRIVSSCKTSLGILVSTLCVQSFKFFLDAYLGIT